MLLQPSNMAELPTAANETASPFCTHILNATMFSIIMLNVKSP
jgi:hypothetical protein